jgi:hypothetical protein
MYKNIKYGLVGLGAIVKLFGVPQTAHCPTPPKTHYEAEYKDAFQNTINLKSDYHLYNPCEED